MRHVLGSSDVLRRDEKLVCPHAGCEPSRLPRRSSRVDPRASPASWCPPLLLPIIVASLVARGDCLTIEGHGFNCSRRDVMIQRFSERCPSGWGFPSKATACAAAVFTSGYTHIPGFHQWRWADSHPACMVADHYCEAAFTASNCRDVGTRWQDLNGVCVRCGGCFGECYKCDGSWPPDFDLSVNYGGPVCRRDPIDPYTAYGIEDEVPGTLGYSLIAGVGAFVVASFASVIYLCVRQRRRHHKDHIWKAMDEPPPGVMGAACYTERGAVATWDASPSSAPKTGAQSNDV